MTQVITPLRAEPVLDNNIFTLRWITYLDTVSSSINAINQQVFGDVGVSVDSQFIPNANGVLYSPPGNRAVITAASVYATGAVNGVQFYKVPNGGAAGPSNLLLQKNYPAGYSEVEELIGQSIENLGSLTANDGGNGGAIINISLTVTEIP